VRAEYLVRRQQFDASDQTRFRYIVPPSGSELFSKHGAYLEVEFPLTRAIDGILRMDGLYRMGNVVASSPLSRESWMLRYTMGTTIALDRALKVKASGELYRFSDADAGGRKLDVGLHLGVVGTY
jgi:hypothetical protein